MKITITEQTARVCLDALADWLEFVDTLDKETRQRVIALDELIRELEAEDYMAEKEEAQRQEHRRMMEEHAARQKAEGKK